jgi:hypothetical protein
MDKTISHVIRELRDKRQELLLKAEKIEVTINSLLDVFPEQVVIPGTLTPTVSSTPTRPAAPYRNLRIEEASIVYLKRAGMPLKTRAIADELIAGGKKSSDMYRAVYNALDKSEEVEMDADKRWKLREKTAEE